jgi:hypothetical protein
MDNNPVPFGFQGGLIYPVVYRREIIDLIPKNLKPPKQSHHILTSA